MKPPIRKRLLAKRGLLLRFGFIISISLTIAAFQWKTPYDIPIPDDVDPFEEVSIPVEHIRLKSAEKEQRTEEEVEVKVVEITESSTERQRTTPDPESDYNPMDSIRVDYVAKDEVPAPKPPTVFPDISAEYPGGWPAFYEFIRNNTAIPTHLRHIIDEEMVHVSFVVSEYGFVTEVAVLRSQFRELGDQVTRALLKMPRWKPGRMGGLPYPVIHTLPVKFTMVQ